MARFQDSKMYDFGMVPITRGSLAIVVFKDGIQTEVITAPTKEDFINACRKYGFNIRHVLKMVYALESDIHSVVFDVEKFQEHLRSIGLDYVGEE